MFTRAYIVLDGGGVRGAALVGCLAAVEHFRIRVEGYAGTSAGALVAALAAAGFTAAELHTLLDDLEIENFLDDDGRELRRASSFLRGRSVWGLLRTVVPFVRPRFIGTLRERFGLYHGHAIEELVRRKLREKCPDANSRSDFTFTDLKRLGAPPLKILATDVRTRGPVVFSADSESPVQAVCTAVRASVGYPLVFRPVRAATALLTDGGLCSNLPVFLFGDEYRRTGTPILAFDLITGVTSETKHRYGMLDYCSDLMDTALEAGDEIMQHGLPGVHRIPIIVDARFRTLDFAVSRHDREQLFATGFAQATRWLAERIDHRNKPESTIAALHREHGSPALFAPVLRTLARELGEVTTAAGIRVQVMLLTGGGTRIVAYSHAMDGDPDHELEVAVAAGCTGRAWLTKRPAITDLQEVSGNPGAWDMSTEQCAQIPRERRAAMAVPICRESRPSSDGETLIVGTLSADSTTDLDASGWAQRGPEGPPEVAPAALAPMERWAAVLGRILR